MKGIPIKFRAKTTRGGYAYGSPVADDDGSIRWLAINYSKFDKKIAIFPDSLQQLIGYDHFDSEVYEGDLLVSCEDDDHEYNGRGRRKKPKTYSPRLICDLDLKNFISEGVGDN